LSPPAPRCHRSIGSSTQREIDVLLCARINGSIDPMAIPCGFHRPVNTALPRLAEMPHRKVALAMQRYPRSGCFLVGKYLVQAFRIETDNDFVVNHRRGCGT